MARSARSFCSADRVYLVASFEVAWPSTAMISRSVAPCSASRAPAAFRRPCAAQPFNPASLHQSRNRLPNPSAVKERPRSLTRYVSSPHGEASMTSRRSSMIRELQLHRLAIAILVLGENRRARRGRAAYRGAQCRSGAGRCTATAPVPVAPWTRSDDDARKPISSAVHA